MFCINLSNSNFILEFRSEREKGRVNEQHELLLSALSITITSPAHNLPPRLRAPGRGLARGPGPLTTRTAHNPIWHHLPQKAHPYLEESDSCPPRAFQLEPCTMRFQPRSPHLKNTVGPATPPPCHVCSVARGWWIRRQPRLWDTWPPAHVKYLSERPSWTRGCLQGTCLKRLVFKYNYNNCKAFSFIFD